VAHWVLRGNDVSYGLYIYHFPIVNVIIETNRAGGIGWVAVALVASVGCAVASWIFVERPFLRRKKAALRQVGA
jgi:peptidoglycan/LPS O-acetylase OafA/YrhL